MYIKLLQRNPKYDHTYARGKTATIARDFFNRDEYEVATKFADNAYNMYTEKMLKYIKI